MNEPIGDRREYYEELYRSMGAVYRGPEPDEDSPATKEEEMVIEAKLMSGEIFPRTTYEFNFITFVGRRPKPWPKKTVECLRCHAKWEATGYPGKFPTWHYPTICLQCDDYIIAQPKRAGNAGFSTIKQSTRSVSNDP